MAAPYPPPQAAHGTQVNGQISSGGLINTVPQQGFWPNGMPRYSYDNRFDPFNAAYGGSTPNGTAPGATSLPNGCQSMIQTDCANAALITDVST